MTVLIANLKEQILQRFKKGDTDDGDEEPTSEISGSEPEGPGSNSLQDGAE